MGKEIFKKIIFVLLTLISMGLIILSAWGVDILSSAASLLPESKYNQGYEEGYLAGLEAGTESGYKKGYHQGYNAGSNAMINLYRGTELAESSQSSNKNLVSSVSWVYIADTGSKYHKAGCSYLKSSNKVSLSDAV